MSNNKPKFTIGFNGAGLQSRPLVETMLQVDAVHITATWQISNEPTTHLYIHDVVEGSAEKQPSYLVLLQDSAGRQLTELSLPKSFRLMQFIELVNQAESFLESDVVARTQDALVVEAEPAQESVGETPKGFANGSWQDLALQLKECRQNKSAAGFLQVHINSELVAIVDFAQDSYKRFPNFKKVVDRANPISCHYTETPGAERAHHTSTVLPMMNLLWIVGLMAGSGENAKWCDPEKNYFLKQWPNFSVLNHNMKMIEMAAKITKEPMKVSDLAFAVETSEALVWSFVNAVTLLGICHEVGVSAETKPKPAISRGNGQQDGVSSLLGKLKKRFAKVG